MRSWLTLFHIRQLVIVDFHKPGKVWRVSDAAAQYQRISLNDCLSSGPDIFNSLLGLMMHFRQESIPVSVDVVAMFSQVSVPKEDQFVLRILWGKQPTDKVEVYQYVRHILGAKCSPTCANYAPRRTARTGQQAFIPSGS